MTRTLTEVRDVLLDKARRRINPVVYVSPELLVQTMQSLQSCDRDHWGEAFLAAARPYEVLADEAEAAGRTSDVLENLRIAYGLCWLGRYPAPNSPGKQQAYKRARFNHARLLGMIDPDAHHVQIPFKGGPGEGRFIPAYLRKPAGSGVAPLPTIVTWGGVDTYKEERTVLIEPFLQAGFAVLSMDMPGTGESPIKGSHDAERLWGAVFDWLDERDDVDHQRVAIHGLSTGGYWATKVAHVYKDRLRAAVNQGGCTHYAFERAWIDTMDEGEYPLELPETLACAWGLEGRQAWIDYAPSLSLVQSGLLDGPCAPMLLINGVDDSIFPIADMHVLLEHGSPKSARFYPGGHMGPGNLAIPAIIAWLKTQMAMDR